MYLRNSVQDRWIIANCSYKVRTFSVLAQEILIEFEFLT